MRVSCVRVNGNLHCGTAYYYCSPYVNTHWGFGAAAIWRANRPRRGRIARSAIRGARRARHATGRGDTAPAYQPRPGRGVLALLGGGGGAVRVLRGLSSSAAGGYSP